MKKKIKYNRISDIDYFLNFDKKCYVTPSQLDSVERIIAIGDIHGDMDALLNSLYKANVINDNGEWVGGNTHVIQVGDIFDRGGRGGVENSDNDLEEIEILHYLYNLNKKAKRVNGRVISLIGNHELMNMLGDFRYASHNHINGLGGYENRKSLLKPGGSLAKKIACNSLATIKVGDWVFCHGGILPEHIQHIQSNLIGGGVKKINEYPLETINNLVKNILLGNKNLQNLNKQEEALLFGKDGVFWTRKYSHGKITHHCDTALKTLNLLGVKNTMGGMVVGHTPQKNINSECNNLIWRIDVGMSDAFGIKNDDNRIEILEIVNNGEIINII